MVYARGESLYSTAETITQHRSYVAFALGCVSQILALMLLKGHESWVQSIARVLAAGWTAGLVIGAMRSFIDIGAGLETAVAGIVGYLGIEAIVALALVLFKKRVGIDVPGGEK